jgi:FKBP-type peptidyl-prolyl cis-trans isomerase FkpA
MERVAGAKRSDAVASVRSVIDAGHPVFAVIIRDQVVMDRYCGEISMRFSRMRIGARVVGLAFCGSVALAMCGCEEPAELVPVTPPGAYIPKTDPNPDAPQALGEAAPTALTSGSDKSKSVSAPALPGAKGEIKKTENGVTYETLKEGTGSELKSGQTALVRYEGKLEDGTVFDSTKASQDPRSFTFGSGHVIRGWDEAIPGMKVGEIRRLTIPPEMAYGIKGKAPKIPSNATLIFDVELVEIK